MPDSVKIHIGSQTRELRFGFDAVESAETMLRGEDLQTVALTRLSTVNLYRIAAAGFSAGKKRISPPQVKQWCKAEPMKLQELERAVVVAVSLHLVEVGKMDPEDAKLLGEARASADGESAGTSTSESADGSASTPGASGG